MTIQFKASEEEIQAQVKARQQSAYDAVQSAMAGQQENVLWNLLAERAGSAFAITTDTNGNETEAYSQWTPRGMLNNTALFNAWTKMTYLTRLHNMRDKTPQIKGIITPRRQEALDKRAQRIIDAEAALEHAVQGALYVMDSSMERANDSIGETLDDFIENQRNTMASKTVKIEYTSLVNAGLEEDLAEMISEHELPAGFVDNLNTILEMGYTKNEIRQAIEGRVKADRARALETMTIALEQGEEFINLFFIEDIPQGFTFTQQENDAFVNSATRAANMYRKKVLSDLNMTSLPKWHEDNLANLAISTSMVDAVAEYESQRARETTEEEAQGPEMSS